MRYKSIAIITTLLGVSSSACADLISVDVVEGPFQNPNGLYETWRIIARFDNIDDRIMAVVGLPYEQYNTISFEASNDLYNQACFGCFWFQDFPSSGGLGGEAFDSYVTIGATEFPANTQFTPDFLGDWGGAPPPVMVILGNQWEEDDGGWLFFGAPPLVGQFDSIDGNETIDVVIAQFTFLKGSTFTFSANVAWIPTVGDYVITPFETKVIPAPATMTLLALSLFIYPSRKRQTKHS